MKKAKRFGQGGIFIAAIAAIAAITMLLWNALIPDIIGWSEINYWQAAGLLILCRLLFGGMFGGLRNGDPKMREREGGFGRGFGGFGNGHPFKGGHLHERFKGMNFEERREFIRKRMEEEMKDE